MKFSKVKETMGQKKHNLVGRNLMYENDVSFADLYMLDSLTPEQSECVAIFQDKFEGIWDESEESSVRPLSIQDGIVPEHTLVHRTKFNMDQLRSIASSGLLATEWFGIYETANEARFCAFLDEKTTYTSSTPAILHKRDFMIKSGGVMLFFDNDNEIMQKLLSYDFFEYVAKKQRGEELTGYPQFIMDFFDSVVEPKSFGGREFHLYPDKYHSSWHAIPGGVPAKLINGIGLHTDHITPEVLSELRELFPSANIYNENMDLVMPALVLHQTSSM